MARRLTLAMVAALMLFGCLCAGCDNGIQGDATPSKNGMTDDGKPVPPEAKSAPAAPGFEGVPGKGKKGPG